MSEKTRWEINERILKILEEGVKKAEMILSLSDYARHHARKNKENDPK